MIKPRPLATSGNTSIAVAGAKFWGIAARNTTANAAVLTVYDNASAASGTVLLRVDLAATADAAGSAKTVKLPRALVVTNGVTVAITGTTPNVDGSVLVD